MWFILISLTLTILIVWDYLFKRRRNRLINTANITGPKHTLPLIGNALRFFGNSTTNIFSKLESLGLKYGKVCRLWVGHKLVLVISDPKYFQVILSSPETINKPFIYKMISCVLGDGLLLSAGSKWRARRKMLIPTYHLKILDEFIEVFDRQSDVLVKRLYDRADGKTVIDIYPNMCLMALDIIAETAMGVKINAQEHPDLPYTNAVTTASHIICTRIMQPLQYSTLGFILTAFPSYLKLYKSSKIMHNFTDKVISDRKAALKNHNTASISNNISNANGPKKHMAFLDFLLQAQIEGKPLKNKEIREEVDTFLVAGHDTTASALSFCLYLLARHADVQQKLFEEIVQVMGDNKAKPVTMRDLHDLKYAELVIRESLRLYPAGPVIGRYIDQDLQVDDQTIPANTNILLLIYVAGRDADFIDNPHDFIPERYYSEPSDKTASFANVPFSAGPRNCIGQKFSMLEMKCTISKMLRHFEVLPLGPDVLPVLNIVLRSSNGMNLGLRPRKY